MAANQQKTFSVFEEVGFKETISIIMDEIAELYLADDIPWVIGYSGGKDSTASLQLVWMALTVLDRDQLKKPVHVISTDTLVENPIVAQWVSRSLDSINKSAKTQRLPITAYRLRPEVTDSFWVNLLGRGYPAPRPRFRWCTLRLKIKPSTNFINSVVGKYGEAILVLGSRKAESAARSRVMEKFEKQRTRDRLSPNGNLPNSWVYTPIEDWSNDDVWSFLLNITNPWDYSNNELLTMYKGATADGECPLVVDTSTPSCGDSRFGCWVCTLVDKDKSMQAMIQNDDEKVWMQPLLEFRDELGTLNDRHLRDFRRMNGNVQLFHDRPIPGPYKQKVRADWLKRILKIQDQIREAGPKEVKDLELITLEELEEIRRIWVVDKHELEDCLPVIYQEVVGRPYPGRRLDDNQVFGAAEIEILQEVCGEDDLHFQLIRELLSIQKRYGTMLKRIGVFEAIEEAFRRNFFEDEDDALNRALKLQEALDQARGLARDKAESPLSLFKNTDTSEIAE